MNETQKIQKILLAIPLGEKYSMIQIEKLAGVKNSITRKTLQTADCIQVSKTGGPRAFRKEKDPKTIQKTFDAVTEPWQEGNVPIRCRRCRFANTGLMTTLFRNKDTVSGCVILGQRKKELSDTS